MASFEHKVVVITGCSSGIGLATTKLFLSRKARVFGIDISPFNQELDETQSACFQFHQVDLTQPKAAVEAVAACTAKYGPKIDVLANVAGIVDAFGSADTVTESDWARVINVNLTVPVQLMQAVLPSMKQHKTGAIVNVASYASLSGAVAGIAYTASKHGLAGATKNVAWRFHDEGIRCNAVLPGGVATNIQSSMAVENFDQAAFAVWEPIQKTHKFGCVNADDVASGIVFLASDEAKSINGVLMPIDNAWSTI